MIRRIDSVRHSFAYLIRAGDASIPFNAAVFLDEVVINFLGPIAVPYIWLLHGGAGVYNRSFSGCQGALYFQIFVFSMLYLFFILFFFGSFPAGFSMTPYEASTVFALHVLRCLTIAVKYSTFSAAELKEMDSRKIDPAERGEKLMLGGWVRTPDNLLFCELERAITRTNAHLGRGQIVFPDVESRNACLTRMKDVLPSYIAFDCCGNVGPEKASRHDPDACKLCSQMRTDSAVPVAGQLFDELQRQYSKDSRSARTDLPEPAVPASQFLKAHVVTPRLPTIPAKLVAWMVVRRSHAGSDWRLVLFTSLGMAVAAGLIPILVRASSSSGTTLPNGGVAALALVSEALSLFFAVMSGAGFLAVSVLDQTRRLVATQLVTALLDVNALVATQMHDNLAFTPLCDTSVQEGSTALSGSTPWSLRTLYDSSARYKPEFSHMQLHTVDEDADFRVVLDMVSNNVRSASIGGRRSRKAQVGDIPSEPTVPLQPTDASTSALRQGSICSAAAGPADEDAPAVGVAPPQEGPRAVGDGLSSAALSRPARRMVSRSVQQSIIERHALLSAAEVERHVLDSYSSSGISLPLLYPQNLIAWGHVRHAVHDFGGSFHFRIQLFSIFFLVFCIGAVAFLFIALFFGGGSGGGSSSSLQMLQAVAVTGLMQLAFGAMLTLQVVQGTRINYETARAQGALAAIQALAFEAVVTAPTALPAAARDRMLTARKVAAATADGLRVAEVVAPARVMFVPASVGLLGTLASITVSGIAAALQTLRSGLAA